MALQRCKILVKLQMLNQEDFWNVCSSLIKNVSFLRFIFVILAFIVIGQLRMDRKWDKEGDGIGEVPGHELGTAKAHLCNMSVRCPRGYWHRQKIISLMSWWIYNFTVLSNQKCFILSLVMSAFTQETCFWNSTKEHKSTSSLAHLKIASTQHKSQHHFNLVQETQQNLAAL